MTERLLAIGDIHGCYDALEGLLQLVEPSSKDTLVALGDYTDRGRDSKKVIQRLIDLQDETNLIVIRGNHDQLFYESSRGSFNSTYTWHMNGGYRTLESYGVEHASEVPQAHLDFLRNARDYYETDRFIFVHGTLDPDLPLREQDWERWRWKHLFDDNPLFAKRHMSGKIVVCGHTPQHEGDPLVREGICCLDTACCYGRFLTAMDMLTGEYWQVDNKGNQRT